MVGPADALDLLGRRYPTGAGVYSEPGAPAPQDDPEVAYYRAYCRQKRGSGASDFAAASKMSTRYIFPSRPETFPVLHAALQANPQDATARFLLGSLYLSGGMAEAAQREWEQARRLDRKIPVLHRNLGLTLQKIGEEARVPLPDFSLEGGSRKWMRKMQRKVETEHCWFEIVDDLPQFEEYAS